MVSRYFLIFGFIYCFCETGFCQSSADSVVQSIFLIGDSGEPYIANEKYGDVLRKKVRDARGSVVLYLGDNIYPAGLPNPGSKSRITGEKILQTQVEWIKGLDAQGIFIPGNHDWAHWGRRGLEYVRNQKQWIDSLKDTHFRFLPEDGCPGPVTVDLNDNAVLVILDTQWFLHQFDKPSDDGPCEGKTTAEVLILLQDILERNAGKRIIIAGHHPLITYGEHGGIFTLSDHLFPLRILNPNLYLPLPVVGSIYPLYRKFFGHIQDTAHPLYKEFAEPILELLKENPGTFYVAGHEHALQFIAKDSSYLVVSGAGSKTAHVRKKQYAAFAEAERGFTQLNVLASGEVDLKFFRVDKIYPDGKEIYSARLPRLSDENVQRKNNAENVEKKFVRVSASRQYTAGTFKKKMLGENYRKEWETEIEVPVFDIGAEKGGLTILQKGGGQQTLSLRLADANGKEYVIRSVEKFPEKAVPAMFRKTFAQDIVQDQISASHPYAALVIPSLANAAGIYHTNPRLVFIPGDPRLGKYQNDFANTLAIFEERPSGNWSEALFFGNSTKIINTAKVLERLKEDNDNQVDQKFVLKSRLFDLVIGDWDRHDDQWRWATIKNKKGDVFRPIPRDRDQAFFGNEGVLPKIWSRRWALPKFEGFGEVIHWPSGLSFNARYFDRSFLTELSREDWLNAARQLKRDLSDSVIESSIRQWPEEIFNLHGERIIKNLKSRRDKLERYASDHYSFLAKETEINGSDKPEKFEVTRDPNGDVNVDVFKITKDGGKGKQLFDRKFLNTETNEVRLFGLGGDDEFVVRGSARKQMRVRIIGGDGQDVLKDSISGNSLNRRTIFYDLKSQSGIVDGKHVTDKTSNDPAVNTYDRKSFQYNRLAPLIFGNYNPDDGVFLGGGFVSIIHGFRKLPFKQRHLFLASVAPATQSFNFRYQGKFMEAIGKWNLEVDANLKSPNYVNNFFGMGNESVFDTNIDNQPGINVRESVHYYRYRFEELKFDLGISRQFGSWGSLKIGPAFQRIEMEKPKANQDRFIEAYAQAYKPDLFNEYNAFAGGSWEFKVDRRNDATFTRRGVLWSTAGRSMKALNKNRNTFSSYESSIAFYHSFRSASRLVFAARAGTGLNTGTYEFYQAQVLDGKTELRGFRKTRFYGDRKFYSNLEVRLRLLNFRSYLFPASFGVLAFHDLGRVWYKDEAGKDPSSSTGTSDKWHKSYGGGFWFTPFNLTVLSAEFGHSREGNLLYVRLGFLF